MIAYETKYGKVFVSNAFFAKLIGHAVSSCYGVVGMVPKGGQKIRNFLSTGALMSLPLRKPWRTTSAMKTVFAVLQRFLNRQPKISFYGMGVAGFEKGWKPD